MKQLILSDAQYWNAFLPLTHTRPVGDLRTGILTFAERWSRLLNISKVRWVTEIYLEEEYLTYEKEDSLLLVPNFIPKKKLLSKIQNLELGYALVFRNEILAVRMDMSDFSIHNIIEMTEIDEEDIILFENHTDLFSKNNLSLAFDFELLTSGRQSQPLSVTNAVIGDTSRIFLEPGAVVEYATLNPLDSYIYIGKNVEIMEGSMVRGGLALGEGAKLNLGTKIYGPTTIGPYAKVGGEVNNTVIWGYSNKGHDGFVGNSVIGQWCNLGADTNSSNLKNNYAEVKLYDYSQKKMKSTGLQFCGMIMGDHSKTAINTQINTGTVIGVGANIFMPGFPPHRVPSFSWGGSDDADKFRWDKVLEVAKRVLARRGMELSSAQEKILYHLHSQEGS